MTHARIQKSFQMGSNIFLIKFDYVFIVDTSISGPSSSRQRNAIQMALRWRDDGGPSLNADLVAL